MTKLLTTGEMIDTLQVGEVAVGVDGYYQETKLRMTDHHEIVYARGKSSSANNFFELNAFSHKAKWRILPRYVSLDEAMEAFHSGATITIVDSFGGKHSFCISEVYGLVGLKITDIHSDNWTIESA